MKTFILERVGKFSINANQFSGTQCTKKGHMDYTYGVKCTMHNAQLDENGFLIDHQEIDKAVQDYFATHKMTSCESMLVSCANYVVKMMSGVSNMVSFEITMSPNMPNVPAKPIYILDREEILSIQLDAQLESTMTSDIGPSDWLSEDEKAIYKTPRELTQTEMRSNLVEQVFGELEWVSSKGHILVTDMDEDHLRNAISMLVQNNRLSHKIHGLTVKTWVAAMTWALDRK